MQITNIYIILKKYLSFETFNDTNFTMLEKNLKILGRNTFNLFYWFNCGP